MFGYIGTIESELKVREAASYKSWYCGLCKCMKSHYGPLSTLFLQYDCAFLGEDAFRRCRQLSDISLPASLKSVSGNAFYLCSALNDIDLSPANKYLKECKKLGILNSRREGRQSIWFKVSAPDAQEQELLLSDD